MKKLLFFWFLFLFLVGFFSCFKVVVFALPTSPGGGGWDIIIGPDRPVPPAEPMCPNGEDPLGCGNDGGLIDGGSEFFRCKTDEEIAQEGGIEVPYSDSICKRMDTTCGGNSDMLCELRRGPETLGFPGGDLYPNSVCSRCECMSTSECTLEMEDCINESKQKFEETDYRYGVCNMRLEECEEECGLQPTPTSVLGKVFKCNDNLFDPEFNPTPNDDWNVPVCIGETYTGEELPECTRTDHSCWENSWQCGNRCQMLWYCNSFLGGCRMGFFLRPGLDDCASKVGGQCWIDQAQCMLSCGTCNPDLTCDAPEEVCIGDQIDDGCGGYCDATMNCLPQLVPFVPSGEKIEIGNGGGAMNLVSSDGNGRTHICDPGFWNNPVELPNKAYFRVMISDQVSAQRIDVIALAFSNGSTGDDLVMATVNLAADEGSALGMITSVYGNGEDEVSVTAVTENLKGAPEVLNRTMTFVVTYGPNFPINLNYIWVTAMDVMGNTLPWTYTDASFKYWDCKVDFEGKLYDDSEVESVSCPVSGWETEASETVNFNSLSFINVGNTGDTLAATIVGDNSFSGSGLMWGKTYSSNFNEDINCDIVSVLARLIDTGSVGTTSCMANSQINTLRKYDLTIPEYSIDPFVDDPKVQIDYSIAQFADPWYQIEGGGLQALGSIGNYVRSPMKMVVDADGNDAGWIAAGGAFSAGNNENFSDSGWLTENNLVGIFGTKVGYDYFYSELKLKKGIGITAANWSGIGDTGVYFVNTNLTIDANNNPLAAGGYRMIVVNGDVTIDSNVSNLYGVIIADGDISVTGTSDLNAQLIIKGMVYSKGNIVMSRGFDDASLNNTQAATIIQFDPNLIFNMPPAVFKVMSDWRQGPR